MSGTVAITLQWGSIPAPGRTGYYVTLNGTQVADAPSSPFTFTGLAAGPTYTLGVQAHDGSGAVGQVYTTTFTTLADSTVIIPTSPTIIGNSFPGPENNMPDGLQIVTAIPAGGCLIGTSWNENTHDANLISSTGTVLGPRIGPAHGVNGVWGICSDGTHIFLALGNGTIRAETLSVWAALDNVFDAAESVVASIAPSSNNLMDCVTSGGSVYVLDPGGAIGSNGQVAPTTTIVRKVPFSGTAFGTASTLATVPYGRRLGFDRQGNLWVMTQGVTGNPTGSNQLHRLDPSSGAELGSSPWGMPVSVGYGMAIACDPSTDHLYVADNGTDQQIKILSYDNTNASAPTVAGTIGQQGGYLDSTAGVKGTLGPLRFAGLRAVSLDSAGNLYVGQTGDALQGQLNWNDSGSNGNSGAFGAIVSKLNPDHATEAWRLSSGFSLGGVAGVATDWGSAYTFTYRYPNSGGLFGGTSRNPDACTLDPSQDWTSRMKSSFGGVMYVRDDIKPGTRYVLNAVQGGWQADLYQEVGAILVPRVSFKTQSGQIITNNVAASGVTINAEDIWMDDAGNVWAVGRPGDNHIYRFRLQGFQANGTPNYDFAHMDTYPYPPAISGVPWKEVHQIYVNGNSVYVSGWVSSGGAAPFDWPTTCFDFNKVMGRWLVKFTNSLPTGNGWGTVAWSQSLAFTTSTSNFTFPITFDVDPAGGKVVVGWNFDSASGSGYIDVRNDSDGSIRETITHLFPEYELNGDQSIGHFDMFPRSLAVKNSWVWVEDDWAIKSPGRDLSTL